MLSQKSFKTYVHRLLKQVHPNVHITQKSVNVMDGLLRAVATNLCSTAHTLVEGTEKKTLSSREVQSALRVTLPDEFCQQAEDSGKTAVENFNTSQEEKGGKEQKSGNKVKPQMRETRAGLTFSVSLTEKYLRGFGKIAYRISNTASVYLTAVLECVAQEILKRSGTVCTNDKKTNITPRHILLAMETNGGLEALVTTMNLRILGAGSLVSPDLPKRKTKTVDKNISSCQQTTDVLMQHAPFERIVRSYNNSFRYTHEFMVTFQYFIEDEVVRVLEVANNLSQHAGRETVQNSDVDLAVKLLNIPIDTDEDLTKNVPTAAITRFTYRAGIKRFGGSTRDRVKPVFVGLTHHYLKYITLSASHNERQTINTKFLLEGLAVCNKTVNLTITPEKRKTAKKVNAVEQASRMEQAISSFKSPRKKVRAQRA